MTIDNAANPTVVQVLGSVDRGGVEMRMLEVAQALPDDGPRLVMITLTGREGSLADDYKAAGVRIVPMRLSHPSFAWRFVKFLRTHRIRVVHSHVHLASGFILALAALGGARKRIANFSSDGRQRAEQSLLSRIKYALMRQLLNAFATDIAGIAPSTLSIAWKESWRDDARCKILLTGFDLEKFSVIGSDVFRSTLGIEQEQPIIAHVGRADIPTKNREGAIRYFGEYAKSHDQGVLVFVGRDGADPHQSKLNRQRWKTLAATCGVADRVYFAGERMDVPDVLASADLLLFTSTLEGLPGVLVEARAAGTPVVASDVPGAVYLSELVSGIHVVSLESSDSVWADAISEALEVRPSEASRRADAMSLRGSDLDIKKAVLNYRELWNA